jgi:dTDP-4-dehydrorhamnose 3,5-epimerase
MGSTDFGKYKAFILSAENQDQVIIPKGFAHGFYVLSDRADVLYMLDNLYSQKHERTLSWNDPALNIPWIFYDDPIISDKDSKGMLLKDCEIFE